MRSKVRVVLIDNYDSFTYNVVQYLKMLGHQVQVVRNNRIDVPGIVTQRPDCLVVSPGPKAPAEAGVSLAAIRELGNQLPILGICLGHQCINEAFGGRTIRAPAAIHGKVSPIFHNGEGIFAGCQDAFGGARYHSLMADPLHLGEGLVVTARTADNVIMGLRHRELPIEGVQFHPESFLTEQGMLIFSNFFASYSG